MNLAKYLIDQKNFFIYNLFLFITYTLIIILSPLKVIAFNTIIYILLFQILFMICFLAAGYLHKKKYLRSLTDGLSDGSFKNIELFNKTNEELYYYNLLNDYYEKLEDFMYQKEKEYTSNIDLINIWGHDIKTPISAVKMLLANYEETGNSSLIDLLPTEILKIEDDVNKVIQLTRINNFEKDLFIENLNIKDIIFDSIKRNSKYFITKKISLLDNIEDSCILSDKKWLSFVLEQILTNSLKYTDTKGKIIIIGKIEGNYYHLSIKDNGIGIAPEDLPRIFDKGFTGSNGRNNLNSTGIGLYLAKEVCNKLKHQITASSVEGQYTEITIKFKRKTNFFK